jgi:histone deacetylase complex subunit SAP18
MRGAGRDHEAQRLGERGRRPPPPPPPPPPPTAGAPSRRPDPVDRQTKCPLLLRTFIKLGTHHSPSVYKRGGIPSSESELTLHTWLDAPLRELAELLKDLHPPARDRSVRLSFAQVYPDGRGEPTVREVGSAHSVKRGADDAKTLAELSFHPGDFLDVAIIPASADNAQPATQHKKSGICERW